MATLPTLDTFELTGAEKPRIGFRVIVSDGDEFCCNTLRSRHPRADATSLTLQHHLAWGREPSPFVSLWTTWRRAVNWANNREEFGGQDIDIAAVWIREQVVYDAYEAAKALPLPSEKLPRYYEDEVIIIDDGREVDFNVLARFHWVTERHWETVTFDILVGEPSSTSLPIGFLIFEPSSDEKRIEDREFRRWRNRDFAALLDEVRSTRGFGHLAGAFALARLLCKEQCRDYPQQAKKSLPMSWKLDLQSLEYRGSIISTSFTSKSSQKALRSTSKNNGTICGCARWVSDQDPFLCYEVCVR